MTQRQHQQEYEQQFTTPEDSAQENMAQFDDTASVATLVEETPPEAQPQPQLEAPLPTSHLFSDRRYILWTPRQGGTVRVTTTHGEPLGLNVHIIWDSYNPYTFRPQPFPGTAPVQPHSPLSSPQSSPSIQAADSDARTLVESSDDDDSSDDTDGDSDFASADGSDDASGRLNNPHTTTGNTDQGH